MRTSARSQVSKEKKKKKKTKSKTKEKQNNKTGSRDRRDCIKQDKTNHTHKVHNNIIKLIIPPLEIKREEGGSSSSGSFHLSPDNKHNAIILLLLAIPRKEIREIPHAVSRKSSLETVTLRIHSASENMQSAWIRLRLESTGSSCLYHDKGFEGVLIG
ncbi:hypothetical protein BO86DRAFT_146482 [Aspergillus japonicus CBS 114.51]|uniref:Uncharacterized protein n=1 Tax=Aspergillus japonicus CBS 114.51 TaxID=1448312 RepID=A0A8T8WV97_ASPJA|nr:hypothetical protein BO86DRAFT_146482 [Aspergillus japonicus CBS 114.51]RAH79751.1 hypothetical protein BO86DRAFT_146482 [Aspergillus japonicus CBS 114.51]